MIIVLDTNCLIQILPKQAFKALSKIDFPKIECLNLAQFEEFYQKNG